MAPGQALQLFYRLLRLARLQAPEGCYERLWVPLITLWYLVWQRLQPKHTLEAVVIDARRGGADRLCRKGHRLSQKIKSTATTAYSDARQRLPVEWVRCCFHKLVEAALSLSNRTHQALPVEVLDGSTTRLRPHGNIAQQFPAHRTRRKKAYWCVARVMVSFCATTGIATGALMASIHVSEQALAVQLMLQAAKRILYIGDRNFGVWRVVRAAVQTQGHALVRLTQARTRRLSGHKRLPAFLDLAVLWTPSSRDQVDPGLVKEAVAGRLILIQAHRRGYRSQTLYLFTTLTDTQAYPPQRLLELYGWRWQAELNFRTVKSTMGMAQSKAKSAEMVHKEFYAGLLAYNLVRALMAAAAAQAGCPVMKLSFAKVQALLAAILTELFLNCMSVPCRQQRLQWLLAEASAAKLPQRRKPREAEPRAQYYEPQTFPKMKGSRDEARRLMKNNRPKS